MNADLYYIVNTWDDLTPGARGEITAIMLADTVSRLQAHHFEEVLTRLNRVASFKMDNPAEHSNGKTRNNRKSTKPTTKG